MEGLVADHQIRSLEEAGSRPLVPGRAQLKLFEQAGSPLRGQIQMMTGLVGEHVGARGGDTQVVGGLLGAPGPDLENPHRPVVGPAQAAHHLAQRIVGEATERTGGQELLHRHEVRGLDELGDRGGIGRPHESALEGGHEPVQLLDLIHVGRAGRVVQAGPAGELLSTALLAGEPPPPRAPQGGQVLPVIRRGKLGKLGELGLPAPHGLQGVGALQGLVLVHGGTQPLVGQDRLDARGQVEARPLSVLITQAIRGGDRADRGDRGELREGHQGCRGPPLRGDAHRALDRQKSIAGRLDLAELNAVPAQFHLVVGPAQELDGPVVPEPTHVAGPVPAAALRGHELPPAEPGIIDIARRHAQATDPQLARHVVRAVPSVRAHHPVSLPRQRAPVRDGGPDGGHLLRYLEGIRPDGGLGGPTHRQDAALGHHGPHPRGKADIDPVAGQQDVAQTRQPCGVPYGAGQQHLEQGRHGVPDGDPLGGDQLEPGLGVTAALIRDRHQLGPRSQHAEGVVNRQIEVEGGHAQCLVLAADAESAVHLGHGVPRGAVRHFDALRGTGGSRGVDDVGGVLGPQPGQLRRRRHRRCGCRRPVRAGARTVDIDDPHGGAGPSTGVIIGEQMPDPGRGQDGGDPFGGLLPRDRDIRRSGHHDAQRPDDLPGPPRDHDRCQLSPADTRRYQAGGHGTGTGDQLPVGGDPSISGSQGGTIRIPLGSGQHLGHECRVGQPPGRRLGPVPTTRDHPGTVDRAEDGEVVGDGRSDLGDQRAEKVVEQPLGEQLLERVAYDHETVDGAEYLQVDPYLRGLGDHVADLPEGVDELLVDQGTAQVAGEHHRSQHLLLAPGAQVAQDAHGRVPRMGDILVEGVLYCAQVLDEGARPRLVDAGQSQRGEIRDDVLNRRIRIPIEQRDGHEEPLVLAPLPDCAGVGRQQHHRGRSAVGLADLPQRLPRPHVEGVGPAHEAGVAARVGPSAQREPRTGGQVLQAVAPVRPVLLDGSRVLPGFSRQVPGEAPRRVDIGGLAGRVVVGEIAKNDLEALHVAHEQVDVEVDDRPVRGEQADLQAGHLALVDGQKAVRQVLPDPGQALLEGVVVQAGQIVHLDAGVDRLGKHVLLAVAGVAGPQHRMGAQDRRPTVLQPGDVQPAGLDLDVAVGADPAELQGLPAADPVGVLDVGQVEGLVVTRGQVGLPSLPDLGLSSLGHRSFRGARGAGI